MDAIIETYNLEKKTHFLIRSKTYNRMIIA